MNTPTNLSDRERELLALAALGELSPEEAAQWQHLTATRSDLREEMTRIRQLAAALAAQSAALPEAVRHLLDAARQPQVLPWVVQGSLRSREANREPRIQNAWRTFARVVLPVAALVMLGFFMLHESVPSTDSGIKEGPITFPEQPVRWLAPEPQTYLLQPAILWKGTPGKTYDLQLTDSTGKVLALATGIQSPWLLEAPLPAGGEFTVKMSPSGQKEVLHHTFQVMPDAAPLSTDLLAQMQALVSEGRKADALMLLMRLPEEALTPDAYADWKTRLAP